MCLHTHRYTVSAVSRISLFAFLMLFSVTMFGQNYGNFTANQLGGTGSLSVSLGQWHGNGIIDPNTRFYVNTADQNGGEIRVTGFSKKGLSLFTSGYGSTALDVQATHSQSFAARFTGKVEFLSAAAFGGSPLYLASHEKLAVRNGMITTSGTGNGISLNGSYYGSNNSFGTQWYGLFWGDETKLSLSKGQNPIGNPIVLSSFYGLGFNVSDGKMTLGQNGVVYIGDNTEETKSRISYISTFDVSLLEYRLYVEDGIRAERVKVDVKTNWADYVFEPDYDLPSLTVVEQFITTNKHLPNVPSAAEVKANGIDIAQMDEILLRKIEELTLYTIEQQKRIVEQQKALELLQLQVTELRSKN